VCATVPSLQPGQSLDVPLLASYNSDVFSTQGVTPLSGEIIVHYSANGKPVEQRQTVTYDLYDRNALTWDDDRKAAAFITPLAELGMYYQVDPTSPFTEAQESALLVDSISLPRETLGRRTGDCDDLTVLFSTMLQTVGIETALVTIPGHIYSAFNTGVPTRNYQSLHPDRNMFIEKDGELWVLVEITLVGTADFLKAWNVGVSEFRRYDSNTKVRGFYPVAEAQELYRPVSLRETDLGLQYGDDGALQRRFVADLERLKSTLLTPKADRARATGQARDWNAYGAMAAQLGTMKQARVAFDKALQIDPANASARLNIGSVLFLEGSYVEALAAFEAVRKTYESKGTVSKNLRTNLLINLGKTYHALGRYMDAGSAYREASTLDPALASRFDYLASAGSSTAPDSGVAQTAEQSIPAAGTDTGRASRTVAVEPILFSDE
jgi:tetratricopeptide (TPR) repeat protein